MVGLVLSLLAVAAGGAGRGAIKPAAPPPHVLNIVHHRLKRGTSATYAALEASIVTAFERAKMPLYWMTFQSTQDPRAILYLNLFDAPDGLSRASDAYRALSPAHPELSKLSARLSTLIEGEESVLTTRRDEVAYSRADVDFSTLRALMLVTFHVNAGHEGKFMDAVRKAGGSGAPWIVYEANAEPTFVLLAPLRSRAETRRPAPIPRPIRELRGVYRRAAVELYTLAPAMSRLAGSRPSPVAGHQP